MKDAKSNKPAKVAKFHYTPEQISQLKSQMGISYMAQSINTLTGLMQTLVNANKDSLTQSDNNNNNVQPSPTGISASLLGATKASLKPTAGSKE
jgi:hypothetical protein